MENSEVLTCKENFFGVAFNRCFEDTIFYAGYFKKQRLAELQGAVFTKETLKN